jgi:hemoglobin
MRDTLPPALTRAVDTPSEIAEMVRQFSPDVAQDDLLGPMFNEVAMVEWSEHRPKLTAFRCRALLGERGYQGNPYRAHALVHAKREFTSAHFERWLTLFHETIKFGWAGPNARRTRDLAANVACVHSHQLLGQAVALDIVAPS